MTPLPSALTPTSGPGELIAWRLDSARHAPTWDSGEGAFLVGGRWSSPGHRVLYTALDPATAILEVAVHKGFDALDTVHHKLQRIRITEPGNVHVLDRATIPNGHWLHPGAVSRNQQEFGDLVLSAYPLVVVPSVVSSHSWNLLISVPAAAGMFELATMEDFALDTRLAPRK